MNQQKAARLLEFVACLNDALLPPTRFGADGAPWEVNLRDIIRWLKLINNVPATHDRQQVTELFLQKFDDSLCTIQLAMYLVGQAGCGKSTVLNHLAAISGLKLFEIAMNPEIDTMDLVGGFEQVDPQRQLSTFLETVWTYTRDLVLGMTAQNTQSSQLESLIQLMRLVCSTNPPLSDIQYALVQLANNSEDMTFLTFSRDCAALSKLTKIQNSRYCEI